MTCTPAQLELIKQKFNTYETRRQANLIRLKLALWDSDFSADEIKFMVQSDTL